MADTKSAPEESDKTIPFYPDHITTELWVAIGFIVLVIGIAVLGQIFPVGLNPPADPMDTPTHVKPEWYFLALYQLLKYVPKTIGSLIAPVAVIFVAIWPFIDNRPDRSTRARWIRLAFSIVFLVVAIIMTIWGELS